MSKPTIPLKKSDRRILLILSFIYLIFQWLAIILPGEKPFTLQQHLTQSQLLDTLPQSHKSTRTGIEAAPNKEEKASQGSYKALNYNISLMEVSDWTTLGFSEFAARNIIKYRNSGGRISNADDLSGIYGIDTLLVAKLNNRFQYDSAHRKVASTAPININTADSLTLVRLYGIGPVLSSRIIRYRTRLGGFVDTLQLLEVYGVDSLIFRNNKDLIYCDGPVRKIPVNHWPADSLARHYYIDWKLARHIVAYRRQHGAFDSTEEFADMHSLTDSIFKKISPYLDLSVNF